MCTSKNFYFLQFFYNDNSNKPGRRERKAQKDRNDSQKFRGESLIVGRDGQADADVHPHGPPQEPIVVQSIRGNPAREQADAGRPLSELHRPELEKRIERRPQVQLLHHEFGAFAVQVRGPVGPSHRPAEGHGTQDI